MSQRKWVRPERMHCVGRALRWRAVRDGRAAPRYGRLDMGEVLDGGHWPEKWCKFIRLNSIFSDYLVRPCIYLCHITFELRARPVRAVGSPTNG